MHEHLVKMI